MKKALLLFSALFILMSSQNLSAQTADEIIDYYFEAIGGKDKLQAVKSLKMTCNGKAQGMELPITMYQKAPNKQRMDIAFQGQEFTQMAFNGKEGWGANPMTMQPEKWDAQQSEIVKSTIDFPDPFLGYKEKGFSVSLEGEETVEGTECYKVKFTRTPVTVDGKEVENFSYYFFDKDTNVPIKMQQFEKAGQLKGQTIDIFISDYEEVEGVYYPHTISQSLNGQSMFSMAIEKIEVNVDIDDSIFDFPKTAASGQE